jgi:hypothetical protein
VNDIQFNLGQGGLGRPLPGEDYINGSLPAGFSTAARIKNIFSVAQAEALGIKDDYADATAATSTSTITAVGADGAKVTVSMAEPTQTVTFGTYTKVSTDADADAVATAIAAIINAGTITHGYSAVADGTPDGELIVTGPKRLGIYLNTKSLTFTEDPTGSTFAITIGAFTGGLASNQAVWHYHISEFFRKQPKGNLFLAFYPIPAGVYDYLELVNVQNFAAGKIRQAGVYKISAALTAADVIALHAVCESLRVAHKPTMTVIGADISATVDLTTLPNMSLQNSPYVMVDIGQDGAAQGAHLFATTGKSITTMGATLGALAFGKVNESIAWVEKFNMSNGTELDYRRQPINRIAKSGLYVPTNICRG